MLCVSRSFLPGHVPDCGTDDQWPGDLGLPEAPHHGQDSVLPRHPRHPHTDPEGKEGYKSQST